MKRVYVVTVGEYEDERIVGIFTSKKEAEEWKRRYTDAFSQFRKDVRPSYLRTAPCWIGSYILNQPTDPEKEGGRGS